jgi:hypothetical protein
MPSYLLCATVLSAILGVGSALADDKYATQIRTGCQNKMGSQNNLTRQRVAQMVCAPGITRCGADGYVEECSADGSRWETTLRKCQQ